MRCGRNKRAAILSLGLALAWALPAAAVPLSTLVSGTDLDSSSGELRFGSFTASVSGVLDPDLSVYDLAATANGFDLTSSSPMLVTDSDVGTLTIEYDVSILLGGLSLQAAELSYVTGAVEFSGAQAAVLEDLLDAAGGNPIPGDAALDVLTTGDAGTVRDTDTAVFVQRTDLHVVKSIVLSGGGLGNTSEITSVSQQFTVVPEPGTAALLVLGLVFLVGVASRRRTLQP
jgi:hypothetical protein